jgi:hypothetical protein
MAAGDIYVASTAGAVNLDGTVYMIEQGTTTVREGHPLLAAARHMFAPMAVTYEAPGQGASGAPAKTPEPEQQREESDTPAKPSAPVRKGPRGQGS